VERGSEEERQARSATSVLIAESDRALSELYRASLEPAGWKVEVVRDAESVVRRMHRAPPAVLLVSAMQDTDQVSMVEQVRSMPGTEDLIIIVLFDSFDRLDTKQLAHLNVQKWLSRTRTTREQLSETIAALVDSARHGRA
jgi:DNA-binding response OmpR family regulator